LAATFLVEATLARFGAQLLELCTRLVEAGVVLEHASEFFDRFFPISGAEKLDRSPIVPQRKLGILLVRLVNVSKMHGQEVSSEKQPAEEILTQFGKPLQANLCGKTKNRKGLRGVGSLYPYSWRSAAMGFMAAAR